MVTTKQIEQKGENLNSNFVIVGTIILIFFVHYYKYEENVRRNKICPFWKIKKMRERERKIRRRKELKITVYSFIRKICLHWANT